MLNVVCVKYGDWCSPYGKDYVNRLYKGVKRNLTKEHEFICFTDDPKGLDPGITVREFPEALNGWWNKLQLFRPGALSGRVLFFDLDTVITGSLDEIASYEGDFITLRDFYRPNGIGSGMMAWDASKTSDIWEQWDRIGRPELSGGDQDWIELMRFGSDRWQDKYPVVSFKVHCEDGPGEASVVCFHGSPRPHETKTSWMEEHWGPFLDGAHVVPFPRNAVKKDELEANLRINVKRDVPHFLMPTNDIKEACIVGGGPSLKSQLPKLRRMKCPILALNGAGNYLKTVGIKPWGVIVVDPRPDNLSFVENPRKGVKYFIASTCHPSLFEALEGYDVTMVHFDVFDGQREMLDDLKIPAITIGGGSTVAHRALYFLMLNGMKTAHLFGVDSCLSQDGNLKHHVYEQNPRTTGMEAVLDVTMNGKKYLASAWMYSQAREFNETITRFPDLTMKVYGDSLLKEIAKAHSKEIA